MTKGRDAGRGTVKDGAQRRVTGEEGRLWQHVTRDVSPLAGRRVVIPEDPMPPPPPKPPAPALPRRRDTPPAPRPPLPEIGPGETPGLDRRTAQRLKRGQLPIEARIDLHGLTRDEAGDALGAFITGSRAAGRRCVLVITGRGRRTGGAGVLRGAVPGWLNAAHLRDHVLAFGQARPKDGGEGAFYVLLRRRERR